MARVYVKYMYALFYLVLQQLSKLDNFIYLHLSEGKPELREVMSLFHNHKACQGEIQDLNKGQTAKPCFNPAFV